MSPLGGAVTMDVDGKGKIWASAPDGVVHVRSGDREVHRLQVEAPFKNAKGTNMTYGAAGDRDGNGWWAQMAFDTVGKADMATHSTSEVALPSLKDEMARIPAAAKAFYDSFDRAHQRQSAAVVARPAPHGHRQERRRSVGRQFLGRYPRPHRHQDAAGDDHPVPGSVLSALPHRGRQEPQRVGQHVDDGSHRPLQSRQRPSGRSSTCRLAGRKSATSRSWSATASPR